MGTRSTPQSVGKLKVGTVINERLTAKDGNLRIAAERLGLRYQRLRQDLSDNRYSPADLKLLCEAVDLPTDLSQLREQYAFEERTGVRGTRKMEERHRAMLAGSLGTGDSGLLATFDYFSARQEQVARVVEPAAENIKGLFHGLGRTDTLFLSIMDEEPIHWQEEQAAAAMPKVAEAIRNGALICYLHPNQALYGNLSRFGAPALDPNFLRARFKDFIDVLRLYFPAEERTRVDKQIACIGFDWPVLGVPHFRFGLYHQVGNNGGQPRVWSTVTVPMMSRGSNSERQTDFLILELNKSTTNFLHGLCRKAVTAELASQRRDSGHPPAVGELFKRLCPGARLE